MAKWLKAQFASALLRLHQGLMMEAICTSETSLNFHRTIRRNIPGGSYLHSEGTSGFVKGG
jgi:hypothetical protein